ncbi:hypothetical protein BJH93_02785 [Kocuria polaris]|nr:hypothetical protein [Kocuria polaris]
MSNASRTPSRAERARADAVQQVMELDGVAAVFPPTLAVVKSLATRSSEPHESLRLSGGRGATEAAIDIAVTAGQPASDVAAAVQNLVHAVLTGHGIETSSVAVTVLEHGPNTVIGDEAQSAERAPSPDTEVGA